MGQAYLLWEKDEAAVSERGKSMPSFTKRKMGVFRLINQTPTDGCLLVFNAMQQDWRVKASDFKRRYGIRFSIHAITGASRAQAHDRTTRSDLYVTVEDM